mmetsp:Transcript_4817/g.13483  ORF Transcript_4817/g.13483 Transcript_4817/m.13483 type:complete len:410 (-) Transcript_4817:2321-3550(-)
MYLRNFGSILASRARISLLLQVGHSDEAAEVADVDTIRIGLVKETVFEECCGSVRDDTVTFHFPKPQTTIACSTLRGLPGQHLYRTTRPTMDFVIHHVAEALVVGRPDKNFGGKRLTRVPVVERFVAVTVVTKPVQLVRDVQYNVRLRGKGRCVTLKAQDGRDLPLKTLNQLSDGHARRNGVRVDNEVGCDSFTSVRHILLAVRNPHCSLLTVTTGEFVPNLRNANGPDADFHKLVAVPVGREHDPVDNPRLAGAELDAAVALVRPLRAGSHFLLHEGHRRGLTDDDIPARDTSSRRREAVVVQFIVAGETHTIAGATDRLLKEFFHLGTALLLKVAVRPVKDRAEETAIDRGLVHHDGIFLVIPRVAHNGNNAILPRRKRSEVQILHVFRRYQGFLRIVQYMRQCVHP